MKQMAVRVAPTAQQKLLASLVRLTVIPASKDSEDKWMIRFYKRLEEVSLLPSKPF